MSANSNTSALSTYPVLALLKALRPEQWVKNVVVFAPAFFALQFDGATLLATSAAALLFCLTSSSFYLINDANDVERDRAHPKKRHRPIAAGHVSIPVAWGTAGGLLVVSMGGAFVLTPWLAGVLAVYAVLQVGYNAGLKNKTIVDVFIIASGFVLRAVSGGVAAGVPLSKWFLLCVGLLALFLAIEKRKAELVRNPNSASSREVLQHYSASWLSRMEGVVTPTALISYALWTVEGADNGWMLLTLPWVIYAIFKYQYLTEHGQGETPEATLLRSPHILGAVLGWAATTLFVLLVVPTLN